MSRWKNFIYIDDEKKNRNKCGMEKPGQRLFLTLEKCGD